MGLFDRFWPVPEAGDMLDPLPPETDAPEIEEGDTVFFAHYGSVWASGVIEEVSRDSFGDTWLYIRYEKGAFGATWRSAANVELLEKAMLAA